MSHGIGFTASYTLSRSRANVESITNLGDFPEARRLAAEDVAFAPARRATAGPSPS